jgi:hypothetical protein
VSDPMSDNIQRGSLRDRMTVIRGLSLTLEEEGEDQNYLDCDVVFLFVLFVKAHKDFLLKRQFVCPPEK